MQEGDPVQNDCIFTKWNIFMTAVFSNIINVCGTSSMKLQRATNINKSAKQVLRGNNQDELAYHETSLPLQMEFITTLTTWRVLKI